MDVHERLKELNLELPPLPPKGGIYQPVKQVGNLLFVSGQGATKEGKPVITGKVGRECSLKQGREAAKICALNALSTLQDYLGDLNRIQSLVKMQAFVASAPGFNSQPQVADAASQLLLDLFGPERGVGARTAVSAIELPGDIAVEIEFIFEV